MYLIFIAWMYVVVMMTIAEAASPSGTLLGALITFLLYGLLPLSIVLYIFGTPGRKRRIKAQQEQEAHAATQLAASDEREGANLQSGIAPDAGGQPSAVPQTGHITPVREES